MAEGYSSVLSAPALESSIDTLLATSTEAPVFKGPCLEA